MQYKIADKLLTLFAWLCSIILVSAVLSVIGHLIFKGYASLNLKLIFDSVKPLDAILLKVQVFDGLLPAITGTFLLVIFSVLIAVPSGIATGIYLSEYSPSGIKYILSLLFDILSGIPSIIVGLFGFSVTIFLHNHISQKIFPCLLISSISLSFLVLPYIVRTTQIAFENIPNPVSLTGAALGATKLQNIFHVLLPQSLAGILNGIILATARCAEDTAVIMLTGVVATAGVPKSILSNFEALPFYIYYISSQYADNQELEKAYGAALILLLICSLLFTLSFFVKHKLNNRLLYDL